MFSRDLEYGLAEVVSGLLSGFNAPAILKSPLNYWPLNFN